MGFGLTSLQTFGLPTRYIRSKPSSCKSISISSFIVLIIRHSYFRLLILEFLHADLTSNSSKSFKYKVALAEKTADATDGNSFVKNTKIDVPLEYLSNFWRSLEMPLIKCKIHLELNWTEVFIWSSAGDSGKLKIMGAKLHVPIVCSSTKENVDLTKQLNDGFNRSVYWNSYQTIPEKVLN